MVVVFRHLYEINYVLYYPCCESFIDRGICCRCLLSKNRVWTADGAAACVTAGHNGHNYLPYLLYVGQYTRNVTLGELPVCQIDVSEAQRIIERIWCNTLSVIEVWDREGQPHSIKIYRDHWLYRLIDVLSYYVTTVQASVIAVPLSALHTVEHLVWELENRGWEMMDVTHVMMCRTLNGKKRKWGPRSRDYQLSDLKQLADQIITNGYYTSYYTQEEDKERIIRVECALKETVVVTDRWM